MRICPPENIQPFIEEYQRFLVELAESLCVKNMTKHKPSLFLILLRPLDQTAAFLKAGFEGEIRRLTKNVFPNIL